MKPAFTAVAVTLSLMAMGLAQTSVTTFQQDVDFLKRHYDVVLLSDVSGKSQVAVVPALQGRVMTSTLNGAEGASYGWINRDFIASGQNNRHMNPFGGEDRFWLGPEGGQFSIFFKPGDPFDLDHWFTPPPLNEGPYDVVAKDQGSVTFAKDMSFENYSRTPFRLRLSRSVRLLPRDSVQSLFNLRLDPAVQVVAFESENKITNTGESAWTTEKGLLSIWILGMFTPSPNTTVVLPVLMDAKRDLDPLVNDAYFGKVPANRLVVGKGALFFKADGQYRSKIGVSPRRSKPIIGSYDSQNRVLTLVQYSLPSSPQSYVNSMWKIQSDPFSGDVVNSYNDGPPKPGEKPMGPFYELETSSPGAAIKPQESLVHVHRTFHFTGTENALDYIARLTLGVSLGEISSAFKR